MEVGGSECWVEAPNYQVVVVKDEGSSGQSVAPEHRERAQHGANRDEGEKTPREPQDIAQEKGTIGRGA